MDLCSHPKRKERGRETELMNDGYEIIKKKNQQKNKTKVKVQKTGVGVWSGFNKSKSE